MAKYPHIESLRLENFTAFADASFEFVPGVNVLIGENGTGKTHVMKVLYAWQASNPSAPGGELSTRLHGAFQIESGRELNRSSSFGKSATVRGKRGDQDWTFQFQIADEEPYHLEMRSVPSEIPTPVFIPAIDMLAHTRGFVTDYDQRRIDFDRTHREIVSLVLGPELREFDDREKALIARLEGMLGGAVELSGERFFLVGKGGRIAMPLVAEGLRKVATLLQLVKTGWLRPGACLFWDEPEVNVNPVLMRSLMTAVWILARSGVQIFVATHSYDVLKELEVQSGEGDLLRFFALEATPEGTKVNPADTYLEIRPNAIERAAESLYDRQIEKEIRELEAAVAQDEA